MKIKIMTNEALVYVKTNINSLLDKYLSRENPEIWIKEKIGKSAFVEVEALDFEVLSLVEDKDKPSSTDVQNMKLFYDNFKSINDSFATDERLWAGLSHTLYYDYLLNRWPLKDIKENDKIADSILNHFFFKLGKPRCYMVNTLARLWWISKKTYQSSEPDPYYILNYISHDINGYAFTLFGSNWSNSEKTLRLFFEGVFKFEKEKNISVGRDLINDAMKYTNCLCGILTIDACRPDFVIDKIYNYLIERNKQLQDIAQYKKENNIKSTGIKDLDAIIDALNQLGGSADYRHIYEKYGILTGKKMTSSKEATIRKTIEVYSPDSKLYNGKKAIFYKNKEAGKGNWMLSDEYLINSNKREKLLSIESLSSDLDDWQKDLIEIITEMNDVFTINDFKKYKVVILQKHPDIKKYDSKLKQVLEQLRNKDIIVLASKGKYKKNFK